MTKLLVHVEQSILARKLFSCGQRILVAVSGGLDSVVLLHLLHSLAAKHQWKLAVAHLNHQLRGRSGDADERFVRSLCDRLELRCVTERANVRAHAKKLGVSIEMAARELRHQFLARSAKQLRLSSIALAHHADDQVELFFLRLFRGAGTEGIAGMKYRSLSPTLATIKMVRPLLDVSRTELEQFGRENKIHFREDASNAAPDILRNRIRLELLPLLRRRFQPALEKTVLRTMDIIGAEAGIVTDFAETWLAGKPCPIAKCPVALQRRIIQLQLQRNGIGADYELIESLRLHPHRRLSVGPGMSIERDECGRLHRSKASAASFNSKQKLLVLKGRVGQGGFDGVRFRWRLAPGGRLLRMTHKPHQECFDADQVGRKIVLRHWQPGDRFQPIGMSVAIKLQDWFTNQKTPRVHRRELLVAATGRDELFWVEDQRISERFKITPKTRKRLIWRWERC